jgi:hypothetical protein
MGGSPYLRPVAMLMVGQGSYLRARALRHGLILGNPFWRAIGVAILAQGVSRAVFKKEPERIAVERLGAGKHVRVAVLEPSLSRRGRKAALRRLEAEALATVAAARRTS